MKNVLIIILSVVYTSCNAQKIKSMKNFDIETFNKNKIGSEYNFIKNDNITIRQLEWEDEYEEIIKTKNSYFEIYKSYYKNGKIKMFVERLPNKFVNYIKEYDESGKLIKETDYNEGYEYNWEDLLQFLKKREVNIRDTNNTTITKENGNWRFDYIDGIYIFDVIIDGKTGEILQDAKNVFEEGS